MRRSTTVLVFAAWQTVSAFTFLDPAWSSPSSPRAALATRDSTRVVLYEICNNDHSVGESENSSSSSDNPKKTKTGDPLRESTGVRPSLHPTTINALASALKRRATNLKNADKSLTPGDDVQPIEVAMRAGTLAAEAIAQRQANSDQDGMSLSKEEEETIAGRVVGVVMRLNDLEAALLERVTATSWIAKYGDWDSFGVLADESNAADVRQRIKDDPLFAMTRAECVLGLFLETVEGPQLKKAGQSVPDKSRIDFLDTDRKEVLLQEQQS